MELQGRRRSAPSHPGLLEYPDDKLKPPTCGEIAEYLGTGKFNRGDPKLAAIVRAPRDIILFRGDNSLIPVGGDLDYWLPYYLSGGRVGGRYIPPADKPFPSGIYSPAAKLIQSTRGFDIDPLEASRGVLEETLGGLGGSFSKVLQRYIHPTEELQKLIEEKPRLRDKPFLTCARCPEVALDFSQQHSGNDTFGLVFVSKIPKGELLIDISHQPETETPVPHVILSERLVGIIASIHDAECLEAVPDVSSKLIVCESMTEKNVREAAYRLGVRDQDILPPWCPEDGLDSLSGGKINPAKLCLTLKRGEDAADDFLANTFWGWNRSPYCYYAELLLSPGQTLGEALKGRPYLYWRLKEMGDEWCLGVWGCAKWAQEDVPFNTYLEGGERYFLKRKR